MNSNQLPAQPMKFSVLMQEYPDWNASYRPVIVTARLSDVDEKAKRTSAAKFHPHLIYLHTFKNTGYDIGILKAKLAKEPTKQAFWCLVRDDSDNTFVRVNVTAKTIQDAIQAALDDCRADCRPRTPADNCGFHVVWLMSLAELETLSVRLSPVKS